MVGLGTFMLEVSCLKYLAIESKEFVFLVKLVALDLPSVKSGNNLFLGKDS